MKRKPNKPKQEARERPGSWESAADPGGPLGAAPQAVPGLRTAALLDKVSRTWGAPAKSKDFVGERRSNGAGGFWRQRRRRSQSEVCDDEVPSEKQTGAGRRVQAPHGGARGKAGTGKG